MKRRLSPGSPVRRRPPLGGPPCRGHPRSTTRPPPAPSSGALAGARLAAAPVPEVALVGRSTGPRPVAGGRASRAPAGAGGHRPAGLVVCGRTTPVAAMAQETGRRTQASAALVRR